jgi:hypothetical protein
MQRFEKRLFGETVIAVRMVRRHATFIAEKETRVSPLVSCRRTNGGQSLIQLLRCPSTRQRHEKPAVVFNRSLLKGQYESRRLGRPGRNIVAEDMHLGKDGHRGPHSLPTLQKRPPSAHPCALESGPFQLPCAGGPNSWFRSPRLTETAAKTRTGDLPILGSGGRKRKPLRTEVKTSAGRGTACLP